MAIFLKRFLANEDGWKQSFEYILDLMDLNNVRNLITSDLSNYNEFGLNLWV